MGLLAPSAPPCLSSLVTPFPTLPLFGPFVSRVTRVRRVFARVGGGISCARNRVPLSTPRGGRRIVSKGSAFKIRISARISRRRYLKHRKEVIVKSSTGVRLKIRGNALLSLLIKKNVQISEFWDRQAV